MESRVDKGGRADARAVADVDACRGLQDGCGLRESLLACGISR